MISVPSPVRRNCVRCGNKETSSASARPGLVDADNYLARQVLLFLRMFFVVVGLVLTLIPPPPSARICLGLVVPDIE